MIGISFFLFIILKILFVKGEDYCVFYLNRMNNNSKLISGHDKESCSSLSNQFNDYYFRGRECDQTEE